jgi:hypothetical protein
VGTSDIAGNAVTAAKIKDDEVKAAEIATDAVTTLINSARGQRCYPGVKRANKYVLKTRS